MNYISISKKEKEEMLARIGISTLDELFSSIPEAVRIKGQLQLDSPLSEMEVVETVTEISRKNTYGKYLSFLGGGAYEHFIPSVVDQLSSRGELVTPYTPYQAEVSQGTLQIAFEFQTLICQLTGLDVANASLYDGSTGSAEAVLMSQRILQKPRVVVSQAIHPQYRSVIRTYLKNLGIELVVAPFNHEGRTDFQAIASLVDDKTASVVFQSPNYFGVVEDVGQLSDLAHSKKALSVMVVSEALSLGLFEAPGKLGADIVTGEAQSFGLPLSFGGPFLGFMACRKEFIRQMPGRIVGQTVDAEGRRGFVLTLSTREQHIRRENATSNICTNQALCAVRAAIFLEAVGKQGLAELAWLNAQKAAYAANELSNVPGLSKKFSGPFFNEFVLESSQPWSQVESRLKEKGIIAGIRLEPDYHELKDCILVCVTEMRKKEEIDFLAAALREALQ